MPLEGACPVSVGCDPGGERSWTLSAALPSPAAVCLEGCAACVIDAVVLVTQTEA